MGAIGLTACDAAPPPEAVVVSPPVQPGAIPPGETLVDLVRKDLADVARDKDSYSRARRLGTLLPTLGPEAVAAVRQTLEDPLLDLHGAEYELLLRFWATHQPDEATRWASEKTLGSYREAAVYAALRTWAQADPNAAASATWKWVENDPILEISVPIALMRGWYANGDIAGLRQFLPPHHMSVPGQRALSTYIRATVENEGSAPVMSWAESLPDEDDKSFKLTVFRRVINVLSQLDVQAATRWCEAHCDGPYGNNLRSLLARNWALRDGPAALAWLSTAPDGHEKNLAIRVTFAQWSERDREAAMAWMATQTAGEPAPWLSPIYPVYARLLSSESPSDAIRWANQIESEKEREHVLIGVVRVWRHLDEPAAESWLAQSSLSEEARAKVREPVKQQPGMPQG